MDKVATRTTATPRIRRRSLTQSCDSVVGRIQAIHDDAKARLDEAGDLRSAMESRIGTLSEAMTLLLEAGRTADEVSTLCAIVDARKHRSASALRGRASGALRRSIPSSPRRSSVRERVCACRSRSRRVAGTNENSPSVISVGLSAIVSTGGKSSCRRGTWMYSRLPRGPKRASPRAGRFTEGLDHFYRGARAAS